MLQSHVTGPLERRVTIIIPVNPRTVTLVLRARFGALVPLLLNIRRLPRHRASASRVLAMPGTTAPLADVLANVRTTIALPGDLLSGEGRIISL